MYFIQQSQDAIDKVLNRVSKSLDKGRSEYPGMSYEQGLDDMFRWLTDADAEPIFEDEGDDDGED